MYFLNDKIFRKNFFGASIIALPFGRRQLLLELFQYLVGLRYPPHFDFGKKTLK